MSSDEPTYNNRDFDANRHEQYVRVLLQRLEELERETNPSTPGSARGKDHKAFSALLTAGELVEAVAGWALDHVIGISLADERMQPRQPSGTKEHPEYRRSRQVGDQHTHEEAGSASHDAPPFGERLRRLILRNLVFSGSGRFPPWLREELLQALDALEQGEVLPLLKPGRRRGPKRQLAEAQLRLIAIARFNAKAYGLTIEKSRELLAERLGMESEGIKTWETRLKGREGVGSLVFNRTISFAVNAAFHVKAAQRNSFGGTEDIETVRELAAHHQDRYGDRALAAAINNWRRLSGKSGSNFGDF